MPLYFVGFTFVSLYSPFLCFYFRDVIVHAVIFPAVVECIYCGAFIFRAIVSLAVIFRAVVVFCLIVLPLLSCGYSGAFIIVP